MRRSTFTGPSMSTPEGRRGLTRRLERRATRRREFYPVFSSPPVVDRPNRLEGKGA